MTQESRVRNPESWVGKKVIINSMINLTWLIPVQIDLIVSADLGDRVEVNNITSDSLLKSELDIVG